MLNMVCYLPSRSRARTPRAIQSPVQRKKHGAKQGPYGPCGPLWSLWPVLNSHKLRVISGFIQWAQRAPRAERAERAPKKTVFFLRHTQKDHAWKLREGTLSRFKSENDLT